MFGSSAAVGNWFPPYDGPPAPVAEGIAAAINRINEPALAEGGSLLSVTPISAQGANVVVPSPFAEAERVRDICFDIATPAGYAVFDPQLALLFDPAWRLEVRLMTGQYGDFPYATADVIDQIVHRLSGDNGYVIAESALNTYIQTRRNSDDDYDVEYRAGGPDQHYATKAAGADAVAELVLAWCQGDPAPTRRYSWTKLEL